MMQSPRSTADCLRDFGQRAPFIPGIKAIADFADVKPAAVLSWYGLAEPSFPKGSSLLRLRCFLELMGYEVEELLDLAAPAQGLARIIGFGVLSVDEACVRLKYKDTGGVYRQTLERVDGLSKDRSDKLEELVAELEASCQGVIAERRREFSPLLLALDSTTTAQDGAILSSSPVIEMTEGEVVNEQHRAAMKPPIIALLMLNQLESISFILRSLDGMSEDDRGYVLSFVKAALGQQFEATTTRLMDLM